MQNLSVILNSFAHQQSSIFAIIPDGCINNNKI
jgi:hypothetical protein